MTRADIYGGDPREVPTYTARQAAQYLLLPESTLKTWLVGKAYATKSGERRRAAPVIRPARVRPPLLSFWNLVEAYVLAGIRRQHEVSLQKVRKALLFVEKELNLKRPLIEQEFLTDGIDLFVDAYGELVNVSKDGQVAMRRMLEESLRRIDRDPKGLADRLFPWSRDPSEPKHVEIDPRRSFGKLVIAGTGVPTEVIAERLVAGDSLAHLAEDYGLTAEQVEAALRWELGVAAA